MFGGKVYVTLSRHSQCSLQSAVGKIFYSNAVQAEFFFLCSQATDSLGFGFYLFFHEHICFAHSAEEKYFLCHFFLHFIIFFLQDNKLSGSNVFEYCSSNVSNCFVQQQKCRFSSFSFKLLCYSCFKNYFWNCAQRVTQWHCQFLLSHLNTDLF